MGGARRARAGGTPPYAWRPPETNAYEPASMDDYVCRWYLRFMAQDRIQWNGDQRDLNYALAWSLMHFLMRDSQGLDAIKTVIEQAHANFCRPFSASQALSDAYPGGLHRLDRDWRNWLAGDHHATHQI